MRAYRYNTSFELEPVSLPTPSLRDDEVLVRVASAYLGPAEHPSRHPERFLGSSYVGLVESTGQAATHLLGKRVLVGDHQPCGECPSCRRAQTFACVGGNRLGATVGALATHGVASSRWTIVLEDELAYEAPDAPAVAGALALAYVLYIEAAVNPGDNVKIVGTGSVADLAHQLRTHYAVVEPKNGSSPTRIIETTCTVDGRRESIALATPGSRISWLNSDPVCASPDVSALGPLGASLSWVSTTHPDLLTEVLALVIREEITLVNTVDCVSLDDALRDWDPNRGRVIQLGT